ncbi:MAG: lactonase family protein [Ginsengibacter sp.]
MQTTSMRAIIFSLLLLVKATTNGQTNFLFVGTYTDSGSKGIYVYKFDDATGKATWVSNTDSVVNPSYLVVSPDNKNVYAVNETGRDRPGGVSAFAFNNKTGTLKFINKQPSGGDDPCYISVTNNKKWAVVANYSGGSVAAFPIKADGSLSRYTQLIQDSGKSINKERQEVPHVHSSVLSHDENYLFTPDLGTDHVMIYHFNQNAKYPLTSSNPKGFETPGGSGPRHFIFAPDHLHAYLIEELSGTVESFTFQNGKLKSIQRIITHPENYKEQPGSADIHISPDGKFLYASNRGNENTMTIFAINKASGLLSLKSFIGTGGKTPRNFMITPSGNYLLVANQNTDNIIVFKRDEASGLLKATGEEIKVPKPVCLQMTKASK